MPKMQPLAARLALAATLTATLCSLLAAPARAASPKMCGLVKKAPTYKHVILIIEENNSYKSIVGSSSAPYINSVIKGCGVATNYHNITHPSLPEYIALTSGTPFSSLKPFTLDCTPSASCESSADNVFKQLGKHWNGYAESMPTPCDKSNSGFYAPRHNPAVYYTGLNNCASNDVSLGTASHSRLLKAFAHESTAPAFATVTPNLCDDMHGITGCPDLSNLVKGGDNWLKQWLPLITRTAVYKRHDTAIFIVWDEGEPGTIDESCATNTTDQSCHIPAIVVAPSVKKGTKSGKLFNHYSMLRTIETLLHLPKLGSAKSAASMSSAFGL